MEDIVEIPREIYDNHPDLVLEIDVSFVNGLPMLTGIDTTIKHRNFEALRCQTTDELRRATEFFVRTYNKAGFKIKRIDADGQFRPLFEHIQDKATEDGKPFTIEMNFANPGDHVPHVERHNRTFDSCAITQPTVQMFPSAHATKSRRGCY